MKSVPTEGGTTIGAPARTPNAPRLLMTTGAFIASTRPPRVSSTVSLDKRSTKSGQLLRFASRNNSGGQAIAFERNRNAEIEIVVLYDGVVFQNQTAKRRVFFHRPDNRPRNHDGRRRGILAAVFLRGVTRFANSIPARVDLQIRRNDTAEFARDRRRKRRLDAVVGGRVARVFGFRHQRLRSTALPATSSSGSSMRPRQNRSQLLTDLDRVADFDLPFAHRASEGRLNRINRFIGFDFAKRIVELRWIAWILQKRNDFGGANSFAHDRHRDGLFFCEL